MSMPFLSGKFNRFAGKFVEETELKKAALDIMLEESGSIGRSLRRNFSMEPCDAVDFVSHRITSHVSLSSRNDERVLVYLEDAIPATKIYLDAEAVCDAVSRANFSEKNKNTLMRAVVRAEDHAPKVAAGVLKKF